LPICRNSLPDCKNMHTDPEFHYENTQINRMKTMTTMHPWIPILTLAILIAIEGPALAQGAKIEQAADKSVSVTTPVYTAHIDPKGNLTELSVKGTPFGTQKFVTNPSARVPTPFENVSINVTNQMVAVRSGNARTEWTFGEDVIDVETEGFPFEFLLDPSAKLAITRVGSASLEKYGGGGVTGIVLANDLCVMASADGKPYLFHVHLRRFFPNIYSNGSGKPGVKTHFSLRLGAPADVNQFISEVQSVPVGDSMEPLNAGGNQGKGVIHFAKGVPIQFQTKQSNRGGKESGPLEYRWAVYDYYIWGLPALAVFPADPQVEASHRIAEEKRTISIPPNGEAVETWNLPEQKPGFYYQILTVWKDGQKISETPYTPFLVDLPHYVPVTTRPADFDAFWDAQEKLLKDTPFNPQLKRLTPEDAPAQLWELTGDMPDGKKLLGLIEIPAGWDGKNALLTATIQTGYDATLKAIAEGKWESKAKMLTLTHLLPEGAGFKRWTSATDNNLLENVQHWLRAVDYLKSRPDVKPGSIRLNGASRGGPLVLITAARRAKDIAGASAHVHTSCGISRTDKPYSGWGMPNSHNPKNVEQVAKLAEMAAYVDPVNHAEYIVCPIVFGYGISDFGLSPPEGIEAAYILTKSPWKRISRDAGGHVYSDGMKQIQKDLDDHLGTQSVEGDQKRILTEH